LCKLIRSLLPQEKNYAGHFFVVVVTHHDGVLIFDVIFCAHAHFIFHQGFLKRIQEGYVIIK
jgi:hypothetical protein